MPKIEQDAFELYHKLQNHSPRPAPISISKKTSLGLPALGHALAGSAGTAISHLLLYPLDLVITRLQVQSQLRSIGETPSAARSAGVEYRDLPDAVRKIYASEGLGGFYEGVATDTAKSILDAFLFFLAYNFLRAKQQAVTGRRNPRVPAEIGIGMLAGALAKAVTTPMQQIVTRKQTAALVTARNPGSAADHSRPGHKTSIADIARDIYKARGLQGFWAGYSASLILTLNPALTFLFQNTLSRALRTESRTQSTSRGSRKANPGASAALLIFLIAAVSKAAASSVTYPFSVAKTRAQVSRSTVPSSSAHNDGSSASRKMANSHTHQTSRSWSSVMPAVVTSLGELYRSQGIGAMYSGLPGELVKGFMGHGLTMALKDQIHVSIVGLYFLLVKTRRRWAGDRSALSASVREEAMREIANVRQLVECAAEEVQDAVDGVKGTVGRRIGLT